MEPDAGHEIEQLDRSRPQASSHRCVSTQFHIHVNCFSAEPPASLADLLARRRLVAQECRYVDSAVARPLWILTTKVPLDDQAQTLFAEIVDRLQRDPSMRGYVECERVDRANVRRHVESAYKADVAFPEVPGRMAQADRAADIHIFRNVRSPCDELDARLLASGFYEVQTPEHRVWTMLCGDARQSAVFFENLDRYFTTVGGISKIELERVRQLTPVPHDFQLNPVRVA